MLRWAEHVHRPLVRGPNNLGIRASPTHSPSSGKARLSNLPRRKRVRAQHGGKTFMKPKVRIQVSVTVEDKLTAPVQLPEAPQLPLRVLTISITDLYQATRHIIGHSSWETIAVEDKAFLEKLRRAFMRHDFIAGVKGIKKKLDSVDVEKNRRDAEEHEVIAQQLIAEEKKRAELAVAKAKWQTQQIKRQWGKWVRAALCGQKHPMKPPLAYRARWAWYDEKWDDIEKGRVQYPIAFEEIPWPSMTPNQLELTDFEAFALSPARPGYETLYWSERLDRERKRWNVDNITRFFLPLLAAHLREGVAGCAETIVGHCDTLLYKYTECDY
ncbi:hypothetical protein E1B28_012460 [Marasmius oreades]|uniref:Uncharacterized protein n=1 Tax=Marasmius oreades TaxID=181124 RepID=A0A9P7UPY6_9AGAR|nr:uncharacterized protein E1B28_012460 [Marasmius oreades]KAG7088471.1 hypothetical protein E1B28_012460 [Marasmius oreades]